MKIDTPTTDGDCTRPQYDVRFKARQVEQIEYAYPAASFEKVQALSERNDELYSKTLAPWIRLFSTSASAELLKALHPMRTSRLAFSEKTQSLDGAVRGMGGGRPTAPVWSPATRTRSTRSNRQAAH